MSNTFIYQGDTYRLIDYGYTKGVHVNGINEIQNIVDLFEDYPIDPVSLALLKQDYNVTSFNLFNLGRINNLGINFYTGERYGKYVEILSPYSLFTKR